MANQLLNDWRPNWFGIWKDTVEPDAEFPSVEDAIDPDWIPADKEELTRYLEQCVGVMAAGHRSSCSLCPTELPTLCFRSDGDWLWPCSLPHYIRSHGVAIPERFAQHIRQRRYLAVESTGKRTSELPWPDCFEAFRSGQFG